MITTACIETPHCKNAHGYGIVRFEGRLIRHHRLVHATALGLKLSDLDGLEVRHKCDNPGCVNHEHLESGTHTDNMRDMMARGRGRQPKGEANAKAKLDATKVRSIRAQVGAGLAHREIAAMFDINRSQVCRIANRKTWGHIQ